MPVPYAAPSEQKDRFLLESVVRRAAAGRQTQRRKYREKSKRMCMWTQEIADSVRDAKV